MSLESSQVNNIYLAGLLHDVGKIGVSEAVLCKPGLLVEQEFDQIKRHPQIGKNILGGIRQMRDVTPAVLTHHERFDGTGYPHRLSGEEISLEARIIAVVDAYDAMTTDRPYRPAMSRERAVAELRAGAGTQFDPEVVEAFRRAYKNGKISSEEQ